MRALVLTLLLAMSTTTVTAAPPNLQEGNGLLILCTSSNVQDRAMCASYIIGVTGAWDLAMVVVREAWKEAGEDEEWPRVICLAPDVHPSQAVDVVINYLKANPEERHEHSASLVVGALAEAWPCEGVQQ